MFSNAASSILILQTRKRRCEEVKYLAQLENGRAIYRSASLLKIFHATLGKLTSLEVCAVRLFLSGSEKQNYYSIVRK